MDVAPATELVAGVATGGLLPVTCNLLYPYCFLMVAAGISVLYATTICMVPLEHHSGGMGKSGSTGTFLQQRSNAGGLHLFPWRLISL